jgi:ribosomal-protein-alanine N-acetyltransferase
VTLDQPRPLRTADLAQAARLHALGFPDEPWDAAQLALVLATPGCLGLALEQEGALAAVLLLRRAADEAEVLTLAVAPACRRQGLGARLLRAGLAALAAAGVRRCFLEVGDDNAAALALYRSLGWRQVGRRRQYYRRGADALVLSLDLPECRPAPDQR